MWIFEMWNISNVIQFHFVRNCYQLQLITFETRNQRNFTCNELHFVKNKVGLLKTILEGKQEGEMWSKYMIKNMPSKRKRAKNFDK